MGMVASEEADEGLIMVVVTRFLEPQILEAAAEADRRHIHQ